MEVGLTPPVYHKIDYPLRDHRLIVPSQAKRSKTHVPTTSLWSKRPISSPMASTKLEDLIRHLKHYTPPCPPYDDVFRPRRAAVLVCLFEDELGRLRVILTKRSSRLSTHSGEVSLPGGKRDEGDTDDSATALREAREEIGLDPQLVTVVTALEPFLSKHLLRVVPVIAILSDKQAFRPVANASEVEDVFDAPLEMFLKDENRRCEEREWMGSKFFVHYFDYETDDERKFVIWGLTASILIRAASIVYGRLPAFAELNPVCKVAGILGGQNSLP